MCFILPPYLPYPPPLSLLSCCPQEERVSEQLQQLERDKELLAHTLADRTAELELQTSKTKVS